MSWYTRGTNNVGGLTTWSTGQVPTAAEFNAPGLDLRTWGSDVDAGANKLNNCAAITLNPGTVPASPANGMLAITAGNVLQQYYSSAWHAISSSQWTTAGSDIYYAAGKVSVGVAVAACAGVTIDAASAALNTNESTRHLILRSTTAVAADIGPQLSFSGASGGATSPYALATIAGRKDGATAYAAYLQFATTAATTGVITERMRIWEAAVRITLANCQVFANNAAAITGGLSAGDLYRTGANPDPVCIVH